MKTILSVLFSILVIGTMAQNTITRTIQYHDSTGIALTGVQVQLYDLDNTLLQTKYTNENGVYKFNNVENGTYRIAASYDAVFTNVNMGDATLIMLYLNGLHEFTPLEAVAADVDGDGEITWADYDFLMIDYSIEGEPFPAGEWTFNDIIVDLGAKDTEEDDTDYGNSIGDVAGAWLPAESDLNVLNHKYSNSIVEEGITSSLSVNISKEIEFSGMGLTITYPTEYINIVSAKCPIEGANISVANGTIKITWTSRTASSIQLTEGSSILDLEVIANNLQLNKVKFHISNNSQFNSLNGDIIKHASVEMPSITLNQSPIIINGNYPNPVINNTDFHFVLANNSNVNIMIYNSNGKLVKESGNKSFTKGNNTIKINRGSLTGGVYIYQFYINNSPVGDAQKIVLK
ncbi:MAG: SdrD B-like domain-containing protein [Bacteroidota bacterium]|nr:SdrD B-like domain-containing protein [Bacteroidota bacterium]